jgi:hypothetical protein
LSQRNARILAFNLMHVARMLAAAGGIPARGSQRDE